MENECVREVLSFEIPSSTEWVYPQRFSPNVFYDISSTIKDKVNAINCYKSELREYPHPRSVYGLYQVAQMWGMRVGVPFAEAFECIRMTK